MNLSQGSKDTWYSIDTIEASEEASLSRYTRLGIVPGQMIMLKRRAPLFKEPLLVQLDNMQVALTKAEADCIVISEAK